jgi:menaquinol-cytochrome c reductase iron-sulfur subunit
MNHSSIEKNPSNRDRSELSPAPRRSFIAVCMAIGGGAAVILGPLGASLGFLLSPLIRRPRAAAEEEGYIKLCVKASDLHDDGTPQQVCVTKDRRDAWNQILNQPVGNVWLRKEKTGEILAFSAICPHLGCSVEHRASEGDFFCPCHNSTFSLDGVPQNKIPPRPMDSLPVRVEQEVIWIQYQQFRGGTSQKIAT